MYKTTVEAKQQAETEVAKQWSDHVYVYQLGDEFDIYWHPEDRYVQGFLPQGAKILLHGTKHVEPDNGEWKRWLEWESRGRFSQQDLDVLNEQLGGAKASTLIELIDDE